MKIYTTDFDTPLKEIAKQRGMAIGILYGTCMKSAVRVVAQNPEILDKLLTNTK